MIRKLRALFDWVFPPYEYCDCGERKIAGKCPYEPEVGDELE